MKTKSVVYQKISSRTAVLQFETQSGCVPLHDDEVIFKCIFSHEGCDCKEIAAGFVQGEGRGEQLNIPFTTSVELSTG